MTSEDWKSTRVLVTGAAGFIGSHLVERLLALGADVTAFVHYNASGSRGLLEHLSVPDQQRVKIVTGDLRHTDALEECMDGCEIVFHLAAIIAIPFSYVRPELVVENNLISTMNVLQAARRCKVRRVVHTSSSEVYGTAQRAPIDESHPLEAQSPYAASKIACDKLAQSFHLSFDLPVVTLRPFNTYGPRQSARAIVSTIITQALTQRKVFLGSMHPTRDFSYVSDTIDAFIRIAETEGIEGRTYHVGSGEEISIGQVADRIIEIIGGDIPVSFDPTRIRPTASEVNRLVCDSTRAKADLQWRPTVSLDQGLRSTIDWVGKNLGAYKPAIYNI
ncbi:MAG: SDR family NAD(P)-dependent oxidoreductase [Candidatus Sumerlaeaceae bacterium]